MEEEIDELWKRGELSGDALEFELRKRGLRVAGVDEDARPEYRVWVHSKICNFIPEIAAVVTHCFSEPGFKVGFHEVPMGYTEEGEDAWDRVAYVWHVDITAESFRELMEKIKKFYNLLPRLEEEYEKLYNLAKHEIEITGRDVATVLKSLTVKRTRQCTLLDF